MGVKIYRNDDIEEVVVAIPRNHYHVRVLIKFRDQEILLHEATIAGLLRAYTMVALHPVRKGVILRRVKLRKDEKKHGFASTQLIEVLGSEEEAVDTISRIVEGV